MRFDLLARDGMARRGRLSLERGAVDTPAFMPVGTYGTVKAMTPEELIGIGAQIVLGKRSDGHGHAAAFQCGFLCQDIAVEGQAVGQAQALDAGRLEGAPGNRHRCSLACL